MSASDLRRRLAAALEPGKPFPEFPVIGRGCITAEHFTAHIAGSLGYPRLQQAPGEPDDMFLIRRIDQLKVYSRHWANVDLYRLDPALLELAAMQICDAAANFAQDRLCERMLREAQR